FFPHAEWDGMKGIILERNFLNTNVQKLMVHRESCVSRKNKNKNKPLALDAKCLFRAIDAAALRNSLEQALDFLRAASSPCRVLHPSQGDKHEINLSAVASFLL
ncbi:MAG: hypothetical protein ACI3YC_04540, partial [Alloprevotella sp.]